MGIETAILIGLTAASAVSSISQANKASKATIREGEIVAANKAKEVKYKAANLTSSFLNSGLELEGTPLNVIDATFDTGLEDIGAITSAYNTKAKNQRAEGRQKALSTITSAFGSYAMGGGFGSLGQGTSVTSAINSVPTNFSEPFFDAAGNETFNPAGNLNWLGRSLK